MKHAEELLLERTQQSRLAASPGASTIKSILFHVHEDAGLETRLQTALSLARACSAHLHCLQVVPIEAYTIVDTYGGTFASGEIVAALEEEAAKVRACIEAHLLKEDVSWSFDSATSYVVPQILRAAALSDLVVIGRSPPNSEFGRSGPKLVGELVCHGRSPLCIPGDAAKDLDPLGSAVIAWNGSVEAANAVRSSVGLLKMTSAVRVIRFSEEKETTFPDTRLLDYLSRHFISAELETRKAPRELGAGLVDYASKAGASYLVMGAYSHTRTGEFLFGGVTRDLLGECPVSLVMAH